MRDENGPFEVKTNEIEFREITSIQMLEQSKTAEVHYNLKRINFTPFATDTSQALIEKAVTFSLGDNGWRINK